MTEERKKKWEDIKQKAKNAKDWIWDHRGTLGYAVGVASTIIASDIVATANKERNKEVCGDLESRLEEDGGVTLIFRGYNEKDEYVSTNKYRLAKKTVDRLYDQLEMRKDNE